MEKNSIDELRDRIGKLENYFKVGVVVAAIFGIGGGFGASAITAANSKIKELATAADEIEEDLSGLDERVTSLMMQVGEAESNLSAHASQLETQLDASVSRYRHDLKSAAADAIRGELRTQLEHRILDYGTIKCDLREVSPVVQWTEVCSRHIEGDFVPGYEVFTSVTYFYSRRGEIPPIYNFSSRNLETYGFDIAVRLGHGRLNEIKISWLAISTN